MRKAVLQSTTITCLNSAAKHQGATAVQTTLHHMLMHTATAAMAEGNKMAVRHMGQAMKLRAMKNEELWLPFVHPRGGRSGRMGSHNNRAL